MHVQYKHFTLYLKGSSRPTDSSTTPSAAPKYPHYSASESFWGRNWCEFVFHAACCGGTHWWSGAPLASLFCCNWENTLTSVKVGIFSFHGPCNLLCHHLGIWWLMAYMKMQRCLGMWHSIPLSSITFPRNSCDPIRMLSISTVQASWSQAGGDLSLS